MKKRLMGLALAFVLLTASPFTLAQSPLDLLPANFSGEVGTDTLSFYSAYSMLCDTMFEETHTGIKDERLDDTYGLQTYTREGMSDVQALYRLSDLQIIAISMKMNSTISQSSYAVYQISKAYGQTFPSVLVALAYLDRDEDLSKLQSMIPSLQLHAEQVIAGYRKMVDGLKTGLKTQISGTLLYDKWSTSYEFTSTMESLDSVIIVHAAAKQEYNAEDTYYISGNSMAETLLNGELVVAEKYNDSSDIKRFDVVVCGFPRRGNEKFFKRVIGLPGETIEFKGAGTYINGVLLEEPFVTKLPKGDAPKLTIPSGAYFVIGDNRANSHDSRSADVGPLPKELILAKVVKVIYPDERTIE